MPGYWLTLQDAVDPTWWRPLERLAAQVAGRADLPPVDPDDYVYCARIPMGDNLPTLHVYRNVLTHRYLNVDELANTWRYAGKGSGYALCEKKDALERADLQRAELLAGRTRRGFRRPRPASPATAADTSTRGYGYTAGPITEFAPDVIDAARCGWDGTAGSQPGAVPDARPDPSPDTSPDRSPAPAPNQYPGVGDPGPDRDPDLEEPAPDGEPGPLDEDTDDVDLEQDPERATVGV